MANIIKPPVSKPSVPLDRVHRESLSLLHASDLFLKMSVLLKAALIYNYRTHALWLRDGFRSFEEWLQTIHLSARQERKYMNIAEVMAKAVGVEEEGFYFTASIVKENFADKVNRHLTIRELSRYTETAEQFINYIRSDGVILKESEIKKMLKPIAADAPKELPSGYESQPLFGQHERILAAGWQWDKANGQYVRPDGTPMTDEELGEFLDEVDAVRVFDVAERELNIYIKQLQNKVETEARLLRAYAKRHTSPAFERHVTERLRDLSDRAKDIMHIIATITVDEEER